MASSGRPMAKHANAVANRRNPCHERRYGMLPERTATADRLFEKLSSCADLRIDAFVPAPENGEPGRFVFSGTFLRDRSRRQPSLRLGRSTGATSTRLIHTPLRLQSRSFAGSANLCWRGNCPPEENVNHEHHEKVCASENRCDCHPVCLDNDLLSLPARLRRSARTRPGSIASGAVTYEAYRAWADAPADKRVTFPDYN